MAKILFSITKLDDNEENGDKFEYIEEKYKNTKIRKEFVSKCSWYRNFVNVLNRARFIQNPRPNIIKYQCNNTLVPTFGSPDIFLLCFFNCSSWTP